MSHYIPCDEPHKGFPFITKIFDIVTFGLHISKLEKKEKHPFLFDR